MAKKIQKQNASVLETEIIIGGVSRVEIATFAKHLSVMLSSGITLAEALDIADGAAGGKMNRTIKELAHSVRSGRTFTEALKMHDPLFSGLFIGSVQAGESSGTLAENLSRVAEQLKKDNALIAKIKGAMVYPGFVLGAASLLGFVLAFVVLPKIIPLFKGLKTELPLTTRMLIAFANVIEAYGVYILIGTAIVIVGTIWLVRQEFSKPITHFIFLKTPIIRTVVRNANLARFCRVLGTLLKSGVTIDEAVVITRKSMGNYYYQQALLKVEKSIVKGGTLSDNLKRIPGIFPVLATQMIAVGEESGKFEDTLFYLADFYEEEVDTAAKALTTAVEPILLIFIGLTVGFLALSIITPIYDITGNIKR